jgi:hypothetical protein
MQVFDDCFQAQSGWNADGQRRCPKNVEFYGGINLDN